MAIADEPDWYLRDWAARADKIQGDLVTELGWHKTTAHRVWHGRQPYRRDLVNQVARWLGLEPYELFLPPDEALKIRRWRELLALEARSQGGGAPAAPNRIRAR